MRASRSRTGLPVLPVLAVAMTALLVGCAQRDSITVGAIPDDYRTNHPIVIAEKNQKIDLPVGAGDRGMTGSQRDTLLGFLDGYDKSAAPTLTIQIPSGSANEVAATAPAVISPGSRLPAGSSATGSSWFPIRLARARHRPQFASPISR